MGGEFESCRFFTKEYRRRSEVVGLVLASFCADYGGCRMCELK